MARQLAVLTVAGAAPTLRERFDEHMVEIAARKSRLTAKLHAALDTPPVVLPAWDPMGSLAD